MDQSQLDALYQQYLGRSVDPSGAASWGNADYNTVVQGILGSQEYQNRQQQSQPQPQQQPQAQPYTPGPSYGDYNFEMTGKPSDQELASNPDVANAWYKFSGTAPAAPITTPPNWLRPEDYTSNGFAAPYTKEQANATVNPNDIRQGYNGAYYSGLQGSSSYFDPTSAGEYLVDPKTNKFLKDQSGNLIPVPQKPNNPNDMGDVMSNYIIPAFIAAGSIPVLGGLGAQALGGIEAMGTGAELGLGTEAMGPTYGELGYTGLEAGQFGPTYGELGYSGVNLAADSAAADAAAAAALSNVGMSPSTLASLLKGGATILGIANKVFGNNQTPTQTNPSLAPRTTLNPTGTNPLANALNNLGSSGQAQTGFGLMKGNVNPFAYTKDVPVQTLAANKADPFAALNVAQTPITPYNPLAHLVG